MSRRPDHFEIDRDHSLADGLVFAGLGNSPGGLAYKDSSPFGNDGVLTSMTPGNWVWVPELGRWALSFDGTTDYVLNDAFSFGGRYPFTLAAWAMSTVDHGLALDSVLSFGLSNTQYFAVGSDSFSTLLCKPCLAGRNTSFDSKDAPTDLGLNVWWHVVGVFRGAADRELYVNGLSVGTDTSSITELTNATKLRVGCGVYTSITLPFGGQVADPLIYDRVLSPGEIAILADPSATTLGGLIPPRRRVWAAVSAGGAYTATATLAVQTLTVSATCTATVPVFTATAALSLQPVTVSASGTATPPTFTATAALTLEPAAVSATCTASVPVFTATAALTVEPVNVSASGTTSAPESFVCSAALTLQPAEISASGTASVPVFTATAALSLQPVTVSASGTSTPPLFTSTAALALQPVEVAATCTGGEVAELYLVTLTADELAGMSQAELEALGLWPLFTASAALTLQPVTISASATATVPVFTATAALTLQPVTVSASGTASAPGSFVCTAALTLQPATVSASGTVTVPTFTASAALTLQTLEMAASGIVTEPGSFVCSAAVVLESVTVSATATSGPPVFRCAAASVLVSGLRAGVVHLAGLRAGMAV